MLSCAKCIQPISNMCVPIGPFITCALLRLHDLIDRVWFCHVLVLLELCDQCHITHIDRATGQGEEDELRETNDMSVAAV